MSKQTFCSLCSKLNVQIPGLESEIDQFKNLARYVRSISDNIDKTVCHLEGTYDANKAYAHFRHRDEIHPLYNAVVSMNLTEYSVTLLLCRDHHNRFSSSILNAEKSIEMMAEYRTSIRLSLSEYSKNDQEMNLYAIVEAFIDQYMVKYTELIRLAIKIRRRAYSIAIEKVKDGNNIYEFYQSKSDQVSEDKVKRELRFKELDFKVDQINPSLYRSALPEDLKKILPNPLNSIGYFRYFEDSHKLGYAQPAEEGRVIKPSEIENLYERLASDWRDDCNFYECFYGYYFQSKTLGLSKTFFDSFEEMKDTYHKLIK